MKQGYLFIIKEFYDSSSPISGRKSASQFPLQGPAHVGT